MSSQSNSYELLSYGVKKWVHLSGWTSLREIQEVAIPAILDAKTDIIITAPTASGKTEAAFLPIISWLEDNQTDEGGYQAICFSPLKALINDQNKRLTPICERAGVKVTPWHGDIPQGTKSKSWDAPEGILMITPESVEALMINRPEQVRSKLSQLRYVLIDEFHSFIESERGMQLLSQLSRIETILERKIPRIALSATIGDVEMALEYLRPSGDYQKLHIDAPSSNSSLLLSLNAYPIIEDKDQVIPATGMISEKVFNEFRGKTNLFFANSRGKVETIASNLRDISEREGLPVEFFPHHGSISKDSREFVEAKLKEDTTPVTAICTSTLEMGIDCGSVDTVGVLGPPSSTSSLRQRMGRSGRRDEDPIILREFAELYSMVANDPYSSMEIPLIQTIAVTELMLDKWIEPPDMQKLHLSTLVQQILSTIVFYSGTKAHSLYKILCIDGPFVSIDETTFAELLRELGTNGVIMQLGTGELICGPVGEKIVSHYTFYAAFAAPMEFRVRSDTEQIGILPDTSIPAVGSMIILDGRRWTVINVDIFTAEIVVEPGKRGVAPKFGGDGAMVHEQIRRKMFDIIQSSESYRYLDQVASEALNRSRAYYCEKKEYDELDVFRLKGELCWVVWEGDKVLNTLFIALYLVYPKLSPFKFDLCIGIRDTGVGIYQIIADIHEALSDVDFMSNIPEEVIAVGGKYDDLIGDDLLRREYASANFDIDATRDYIRRILSKSLDSIEDGVRDFRPIPQIESH